MAALQGASIANSPNSRRDQGFYKAQSQQLSASQIDTCSKSVDPLEAGKTIHANCQPARVSFHELQPMGERLEHYTIDERTIALLPRWRRLSAFVARCLAWMGSNKAVTTIGLVTLALGIAGLYVAIISYSVAYRTYAIERWKDCQDRLVSLHSDIKCWLQF